MTNIISGQKTGGQYLVGGLDCTVHRNFFGSQVNACAMHFKLYYNLLNKLLTTMTTQMYNEA